MNIFYCLKEFYLCYEMNRMQKCPICGEEYSEDEMIGEVCISCAGIMQDQDFEC